jgi:3',5'-cyclic-nucleotide phosphodiesterase
MLADMDGANRKAQEELDELLQAVRQANEPLRPEVERSALSDLSRRTYADIDGSRQPLLTADELAALSIPRGCLSKKEASQIQMHVSYSFRILSTVPWTGAYSRIPEIVHAHHEKMDGSGYPRGLSGAEIPVGSRMIGIADVYDALVASDRPYKHVLSAERALDILQDEAKQGRLDADLLQLFIEEKVYELI